MYYHLYSWYNYDLFLIDTSMYKNFTPIMSIEQREMLAQDLLDLVKDLKWNERIRLKSYSIEWVYRLQSGAVATIVSQKIQKLIEIVKYILTSEKLQQYSLEIETNTLPDWGSETVIYIKRYVPYWIWIPWYVERLKKDKEWSYVLAKDLESII